jgi:hypothetical protein
VTKTINLFLLIIFSQANICLAQWNYFTTLNTHSNNPFGPVGGVRDVIFATRDTGIYCYSVFLSPSSGSETHLKLTTNGANDWISKYSNTNIQTSPRSVYFGPPNTFYFVRTDYIWTIMKSNDLGASWYQPLWGHLDFGDLCAPDSNTFFVHSTAGLTRCINDNCVLVDSFSSPLPHPQKIFFTDSMNGYGIFKDSLPPYHTNKIMRTISGGTSWSPCFYDTSTTFTKLFFLSPNIGYIIADEGKIIKTIDTGQTWEYVNSGQLTDLTSIYFINDTLGFVAGDSGLIMKTINGGLSWSLEIINTTESIRRIFFAAPDIMYALVGNSLYITYPFSGTGIWEMEEDSFSIYPNPTTSTLTIQNASGLYHLSDITGKTLLSGIASGETFTLDISALSSGVYFLTLSEDGQQVVRKVIKQ